MKFPRVFFLDFYQIFDPKISLFPRKYIGAVLYFLLFIYIAFAVYSYDKRAIGDVGNYFLAIMAGNIPFPGNIMRSFFIWFPIELIPYSIYQFTKSVDLTLFALTLSPILIQFLIFIIIFHIYKNFIASIALVGLIAIDYGALFYVSLNNHVLFAYIVLLVATLNRLDGVGLKNVWEAGKRRVRVFEIVLLIYLSLAIPSTHEVGAFALIFIFGLRLVQNRRLVLFDFLSLGVVVGIFTIKLSLADPYQSQILGNISWSSFGLRYYWGLGKYIIHTFPLSLILAFYLLGVSVWQKKWFAVGVAILGTGVLLGIVGLVFPFNRHSVLYGQYAYSSITVFAVIFLIIVFRGFSQRVQNWSGIVVLVLFVLGLVRIVDLYDVAERRLSYMNRVMHSEGALEHQRLMVNLNNVPEYAAQLYPVHFFSESLLQSYRLGLRSPATLTPYKNRKVSEKVLRKAPFFFDEAKGDEYYQLNSPGRAEEITDEFVAGISLSVTPPPRAVKRSKRFYPMVTIRNANDRALPTAYDPKYRLFLAYHWLRGDQVVVWDGIRTPIEVDVKTQYRQPIVVRVPPWPGNYTLVVDIVLEGVRWFRRSASLEVVVR